jgi:hypothetical protein
MNKLSLIALLAALPSLHATILDIPLGGNTADDFWTTDALTTAANPGFPRNPGGGAWPGTIGSSVGADAVLAKTSDGPGGYHPYFGDYTGGPYPGGGSLYFGGFSNEPNLFGGSVAIQDPTPLTGVKTIVFQIIIGEAFGYDFYDGLPALTINGNTPITLGYSSLFDQAFKGTFTPPPPDNTEQNLYWNTYAFQWDLSGIIDPITSIQIDLSAVQHAQITEMKLQQSDAAYSGSLLPAAIPEPSTGLLLGLGTAALWNTSRRRRA